MAMPSVSVRLSAEDLAIIADLPPFEALRSQLLGLFMQNAAAFVRVLDAKVKKDQPADQAGEKPAEQPAPQA